MTDVEIEAKLKWLETQVRGLIDEVHSVSAPPGIMSRLSLVEKAILLLGQKSER
jgi:hypothetical protein